MHCELACELKVYLLLNTKSLYGYAKIWIHPPNFGHVTEESNLQV